MTNPLEQIRELADGLKIRAANLDGKPLSRKYMGKALGYRDCASEIIAILDASQGYVCVPVEDTSLLLEAFGLVHGHGDTDGLCKYCDAVNRLTTMLAASKETNRG